MTTPVGRQRPFMQEACAGGNAVAVIPSERSESRDLHLYFSLRAQRTQSLGKLFSVFSVLSVRGKQFQAIRPCPRDRRSGSALRRCQARAAPDQPTHFAFGANMRNRYASAGKRRIAPAISAPSRSSSVVW